MVGNQKLYNNFLLCDSLLYQELKFFATVYALFYKYAVFEVNLTHYFCLQAKLNHTVFFIKNSKKTVSSTVIDIGILSNNKSVAHHTSQKAKYSGLFFIHKILK